MAEGIQWIKDYLDPLLNPPVEEGEDIVVKDV